MYRLMLEIVRPELVAIWRLAAPPTRRSPSLVKATTLGVVRSPSALVMTTGLPPSTTATQELVVPRSMPITLLILFPLFLVRRVCGLIFLQSILPDGCDHFLVQL